MQYRSAHPSIRRGFRAFTGERMEGMAWDFSCWCILTTFRTNQVLVMLSAAVNEKSWFGQGTTKLVRWVVHTNFGWSDINTLKKRYGYFDNHMSNVAASFGMLGQKKSLGCQSDQYLLISGSSDRFIGRIWWPGDRLAAALHALLIFLIMMPLWLSETGHIWGFWALSGERMGVNVDGGTEDIFPTLCVKFCLVLLLGHVFFGLGSDCFSEFLLQQIWV